jgi:hypothetical protein
MQINIGLWELKKMVEEMEKEDAEVFVIETTGKGGILKKKGIKTVEADGIIRTLNYKVE